MNPHSHIPSGDEIGIAVMAEPAAESRIDPDSLAHRDPPRKLDIAVAHLRVTGECILSLPEEYFYAFSGYLL